MNKKDLKKIKDKLKSYSKNDIVFSNHAKLQIILREGNQEFVVSQILNPKNLIDVVVDKKENNLKYVLIFKISNSKTMKLPVILDKKGKKELYIITYIMRYRKWKKIISPFGKRLKKN